MLNPALKNTLFTEFLVRANALEDSFKEWVFRDGMLFNDFDKWWGRPGKRGAPHEGLDLCMYMDRQGSNHSLDGKTKIPAMYDGVVAGIIDDFLGRTVFIEHSFSEHDNSRFCTIYGHTTPRNDLHAGMTVREGDVIAALADTRSVPPHLHISIGWSPEAIAYERLDWEVIGSGKVLTLIDPLKVIRRDHSFERP